jgi:hypothetical protein
MPTINACFVSYMHSPAKGFQELIEKFWEALSMQVAMFMPKYPVFLDQRRLAGGDTIDAKLSIELCRSGCLVLLFNPSYFDREYTYCAREYKAMALLEEQRLESVSLENRRTQGLIIPVILRGGEDLPREIKSRKCFSIEQPLLQSSDLSRKEIVSVLRSIAGAIYERHKLTRKVGASIGGCDAFSIPDEASIRPWLEEILADAPEEKMPGS